MAAHGPSHCTFCGAIHPEALALRAFDATCCRACAARVGKLVLAAPDELVVVWPRLAADDDGEPEPRIRRADGTSQELREVTASLKEELTLDARLELASTLAGIGLHRESLLECAYVLAQAAPAVLAQRALDLLFERRFTAPTALDTLRSRLLPS